MVYRCSAAAVGQKTIPFTPLDVSLTKLSFLSQPDALQGGAKVAVTICERLYKLLEEPTLTPTERHNILDAMSNTLCLVLDPCEFVRHMHPQEDYRHGSQAAFTEAHTFMCELNTSTYLYDQLKILSASDSQSTLDDETKKNVAQLKRDMESNGIHLDDARRKIIAELNIEKEEIAAEFLQESGQQNPIGVLRKLLKSRQKLADRLGFECYADQQLRGTILDTQDRVWHFLCAVSHKYWPKAVEEIQFLRTLQGVKKAQDDFTDEARALTSHSYRGDMDSLNLEKYFSVANCCDGIKILCKEAFGLTLEKVPMQWPEQYHIDVEKYAVVHEKEGFMGTILVDLFARHTKACQAGHMTVQLGCRPHVDIMRRVGVTVPERQFPIVVLTCNAGSLRKPLLNSDGTANKATTLMHPHEVTTMFHEFGHAVHSIFGQTKVQNLAGTRSSIDFVETFSQFFELFLTNASFVQRWAKDNDGNVIPTSVIEKYAEIRTKLRALDIMDQVVMSGIDQALHGPQPVTTYFPKPGSKSGELAKKVLGHFDEYGNGIFDLARLMVDISRPLSPVVPTQRGVLRSLSMEHMSSYPATYYGYLYSAVFARRIWDKFFAKDPLSRVEGERLRNEVLKYGAACNPREVLQLYLRENLDDLEVWV